MKLESDVVKRVYAVQIDAMNRELANGHTMVENLTKQLENVRTQILRIEGARMMAERMLADVVAKEKETSATKTPQTADEVVGRK